MPGGFGGGPRRGGGGPVNNSRYYEVLGVPKDADEATIKKVRKSRGQACRQGHAAVHPQVRFCCPPSARCGRRMSCRDKAGAQHSSERLHTLPRCRRCWVLQAHRKAALKHHPDKGGDEEKFKEVRFLTSKNTPDRRNQLRAWLLALAWRWVAVPAAHLLSCWSGSVRACSGGLAPNQQQPHVCCGQPAALSGMLLITALCSDVLSYRSTRRMMCCVTLRSAASTTRSAAAAGRAHCRLPCNAP